VRLAAAVLLMASARACGRSAAPEQAPPPVMADELITALCDASTPCCALAGRSDGVQRCRSGLEALLGRGVLDPQAAGKCLAALRSGTPESSCELLSSPRSACQRAITPARSPGNRQPGESCASYGDCAAAPGGEVVCRGGPPPPGAPPPPGMPPPGMPPPGQPWCELQVRGHEGDGPCAGTVLERSIIQNPERPGVRPAKAYLCYREDDLHCDAGARCVRALPAGASCQSDAECGKSAYCRSIVFACRPFIAVGAPCNSEVACIDGAYCPLDTRTCTAWLPAGAPCSSDAQCRSRVCEDQRCAPLLDPRDWPLFVARFCAAADAGTSADGP
jgi:hypothetical protein